MSMHERRQLAKALRSLPPDWTITLTVREILELMGSTEEVQAVRWIKSPEAEAITGVRSTTLRNRASKWLIMQERGQRPEIHVARMGDSDRAHWLFDEADCYDYARAHGTGFARQDSEDEMRRLFGGSVSDMLDEIVRESAEEQGISFEEAMRQATRRPEK